MPQPGVIEVNALTRKQTRISILIIGTLFFIFGFVSWVNAILIPYFKVACELSHFKAYLVTFAFYISYFIMSVPARSAGGRLLIHDQRQWHFFVADDKPFITGYWNSQY